MIRDPFDVQANLLISRTVRMIVDAGAYHGDTVAAYLARFPSAHVLAFEPTAATFGRLTDRFADEPRVETVRAALGERAGAATLHRFAAPAANSLLPLVAGGAAWSDTSGGLDGAGTERVDVETLDAFARRRGLEQIDILKMDLQGGERRALYGAQSLLRRRAIGLIYAEVLFVALYDGQAYFRDVDRELAIHGYALYDLVGARHDDGGRLKWAEAIYLPS